MCRQCVPMCHLGVTLAGCLCVSSVCTDVSPWYCSSWLHLCMCSQCVLMRHLGIVLAGCVCRQCVLICHLGVALAGFLCVCIVSVY